MRRRGKEGKREAEREGEGERGKEEREGGKGGREVNYYTHYWSVLHLSMLCPAHPPPM